MEVSHYCTSFKHVGAIKTSNNGRIDIYDEDGSAVIINNNTYPEAIVIGERNKVNKIEKELKDLVENKIKGVELKVID